MEQRTFNIWYLLIALTKSGRVESAAHAVVEMLSDKVIPDVSMDQLHIRLALETIEAGDASETRHHLQHYAEGASGTTSATRRSCWRSLARAISPR